MRWFVLGLTGFWVQALVPFLRAMGKLVLEVGISVLPGSSWGISARPSSGISAMAHEKTFYLWDRLLLRQHPPISTLEHYFQHDGTRYFKEMFIFSFSVAILLRSIWACQLMLNLFWRNSLRLVLKYSVLLSLLTMEIFVSNCVSTICEKYLNILETSDFSCIR